MTFAQRLRELRTVAGLSEVRLAELSGVSFGAIHNYGLGIRKPTFAAVVRLCRALGVTCEAFAECEDIADEPPADAVPQGPKRRREANPSPAKKPRTRGPKVE
jgi:transcriptional regulator with XRE-family HTH domain